ncbi:hypothetical protein B0H12DRAFT_1241725 [Mycena haematopus]|nr:hypothetical protein B0H12DRAFT_1241725 [Mycena haematopus]
MSDGHPVSPLETNGADDDDYGSDEGAPEPLPNWSPRENMRQFEALQCQEDGYVPTRAPRPESTGLWRDLSIDTPEQAHNILRWVRRTEPSAYALAIHTQNVLEAEPTLLRTAGEVYLLSKLRVAKTRYWLRSTGQKTAPRSTHVPMDGDVEMLPAHIYFGTSVQDLDTTTVLIAERPENDGSVQSGTHTILTAAIRLYENMPAREWPLGMRISATAFPRSDVEHASPYTPDIRAWYTIQALCPRRPRRGGSHNRATFFLKFISILSVHGAFHRIAQFGGYPDASLPLEHYPFITANICESQIVAWAVHIKAFFIAKYKVEISCARLWTNGRLSMKVMNI